MANRFLGEVTVAMAGATYTLRCDFNAMCAFEEATGKAALAAFEAMEQGGGSISDLRQMVRACLLRHHPDASLELAGDILSEDLEVVARLIAAAAPEPNPDAKPGKARAA